MILRTHGSVSITMPDNLVSLLGTRRRRIGSLLGLTGKATKACPELGRKVIKKIRKKVDKFIGKLILKAQRLFKKKGGKGKDKDETEGGKGDHFGKDKTKTPVEVPGEKHTLFVEESKNGRPQLMIQTQKMTLEGFLDSYEEKNELTEKQAKVLKDIRDFIKNSQKPAIEKVRKADQEGKPSESLYQDMLAKEKSLGELLKKLINSSEIVQFMEEKYGLEGMTGTYNSLPKPVGDEFTPDHQPQAAILEEAAELEFFDGAVNLKKRAAGRAQNGIAINLHEIRHKAGRTFGGKGTATKDEFLRQVNSKISPSDTVREKRKIVVDFIKKDLKADVAAMKKVVNVSDKHKHWADINVLSVPHKEKKKIIDHIKARILLGEDAVSNQNLDELMD